MPGRDNAMLLYSIYVDARDQTTETVMEVAVEIFIGLITFCSIISTGIVVIILWTVTNIADGVYKLQQNEILFSRPVEPLPHIIRPPTEYQSQTLVPPSYGSIQVISESA